MSYLQKITLMKTFPNSVSELQNRLIRRIFLLLFLFHFCSKIMLPVKLVGFFFFFISCFFKHKVKNKEKQEMYCLDEIMVV